jgi:hypothetical protein
MIPFTVSIKSDVPDREVVCVSLSNRYRLTAVVPDAPEFPTIDAAKEWLRAHGHAALVDTLVSNKDYDGFECWLTSELRWLEPGDEQVRVIEEIDASNADWPSDEAINRRVSAILGRPVHLALFDTDDDSFDAVYKASERDRTLADDLGLLSATEREPGIAYGIDVPGTDLYVLLSRPTGADDYETPESLDDDGYATVRGRDDGEVLVEIRGKVDKILDVLHLLLATDLGGREDV